MNVINATYSTTDICQYDMILSAMPVALLTEEYFSSEKKPKKQNVRKELLNELYSLYLNECNKEYYVKNRKRYYSWIRSNHIAALRKKDDYDKYKESFRKAKLPDHQRFLKPMESGSYLWWGRFSHLKGEEGNECLRVIISNVKDMQHRKLPIISYVLGAAGKLSTDTLA